MCPLCVRVPRCVHDISIESIPVAIVYSHMVYIVLYVKKNYSTVYMQKNKKNKNQNHIDPLSSSSLDQIGTANFANSFSSSSFIALRDLISVCALSNFAVKFWISLSFDNNLE